MSRESGRRGLSDQSQVPGGGLVKSELTDFDSSDLKQTSSGRGWNTSNMECRDSQAPLHSTFHGFSFSHNKASLEGKFGVSVGGDIN